MARDIIELAASDKKGRIFKVSGLEGAGAKGGIISRLSPGDLIKLPFASELFMLPGRAPVAFDPRAGVFKALDDLRAVAAFLSPGYTITHHAAYLEHGAPKNLPLFSYGVVVFYKGSLYTAATRVDLEKRQDIRLMDMGAVRKNARRFKKLFPKNRLIEHLTGCALTYGCPAARNFFLSRYEGPLPTSPYCNARCIGCISHQPKGACSITQPRIKFKPSPDEVAEAALWHIKNVSDPVVSFGQGCEGEPLMAEDVLLRSIRMIRRNTSKGVINLNTNAYSPKTVSRLADAGLDSIRVSMNSARGEHYSRYYKPIGYSFKDVARSIRAAKRRGVFVSINYLSMPGFTDSKKEFGALRGFIKANKIDMIQWRNLNYDPLRYFKAMKVYPQADDLIGVREIISSIHEEFPRLMKGYFNPSRRRMQRKIAPGR
jgi:MoaA/NifB/PqqE/SkfB family radical SAM enzyme